MISMRETCSNLWELLRKGQMRFYKCITKCLEIRINKKKQDRKVWKGKKWMNKIQWNFRKF